MTCPVAHVKMRTILNNIRFLLFFFIILLNACAVTGPADDGFERGKEWVDNGRLGSADSKIIISTQQAPRADKPSVTKPFDSSVLDGQA
jgi:hypothetical protein